MLKKLADKGFEIQFESHAAAILEKDFPNALDELESALVNVSVPITEIIGSGGGEAHGTQRMRKAFHERGWGKGVFEIKKTINGVERESISHEVDHVRSFDGHQLVALEIEWNNKDPFFDRDLENFKRLHAEGAISVGIIVTRGPTLQDSLWEYVRRFASARELKCLDDLAKVGLDPTRRQRTEISRLVERKKNPIDFATAWTEVFVSDKFGAATTHWRKLLDRIDRGVGNPCPLLLLGLPASIVTFDFGGPIVSSSEELGLV